MCVRVFLQLLYFLMFSTTGSQMETRTRRPSPSPWVRCGRSFGRTSRAARALGEAEAFLRCASRPAMGNPDVQSVNTMESAVKQGRLAGFRSEMGVAGFLELVDRLQGKRGKRCVWASSMAPAPKQARPPPPRPPLRRKAHQPPPGVFLSSRYL